MTTYKPLIYLPLCHCLNRLSYDNKTISHFDIWEHLLSTDTISWNLSQMQRWHILDDVSKFCMVPKIVNLLQIAGWYLSFSIGENTKFRGNCVSFISLSTILSVSPFTHWSHTSHSWLPLQISPLLLFQLPCMDAYWIKGQPSCSAIFSMEKWCFIACCETIMVSKINPLSAK